MATYNVVACLLGHGIHTVGVGVPVVDGSSDGGLHSFTALFEFPVKGEVFLVTEPDMTSSGNLINKQQIEKFISWVPKIICSDSELNIRL